MNKKEHIEYWIGSAERDLKTAESLFASNKNDWCLFIGHLVIEKILKAAFVKNNQNKIPPKTHNLVKLAKLTKLNIDDEQILLLDEINDFNLAVRYPEYKNEFYKLCTNDFTNSCYAKLSFPA